MHHRPEQYYNHNRWLWVVCRISAQWTRIRFFVSFRLRCPPKWWLRGTSRCRPWLWVGWCYIATIGFGLTRLRYTFGIFWTTFSKITVSSHSIGYAYLQLFILYRGKFALFLLQFSCLTSTCSLSQDRFSRIYCIHHGIPKCANRFQSRFIINVLTLLY